MQSSFALTCVVYIVAAVVKSSGIKGKNLQRKIHDTPVLYFDLTLNCQPSQRPDLVHVAFRQVR
jgi:hypothetical protein